MKDKRIDEILKSAFGDLNRGLGPLTEEERLEFEKARAIRDGLAALKDVPECQLSTERLRDAVYASMTPAQRTEFQLSNKIHAGLDSLKDVPEHQLSNERLRTAVLGSAVRPRRISGWSLVTAGVACLAVGLAALRELTPTPVENPIVKNDTTTVPTTGGSDNASVRGTDQTKIDVPTGDQGAKSPTFVAIKDAAETAPMSPDYRSFEGALAGIVKEMDFSLSEEPVAPAAMNAGPEVATKDTIVVVDPNSRTRNGAAKATEMASYGDVVFGG